MTHEFWAESALCIVYNWSVFYLLLWHSFIWCFRQRLQELGWIYDCFWMHIQSSALGLMHFLGQSGAQMMFQQFMPILCCIFVWLRTRCPKFKLPSGADYSRQDLFLFANIMIVCNSFTINTVLRVCKADTLCLCLILATYFHKLAVEQFYWVSNKTIYGFFYDGRISKSYRTTFSNWQTG